MSPAQLQHVVTEGKRTIELVQRAIFSSREWHASASRGLNAAAARVPSECGAPVPVHCAKRTAPLEDACTSRCTPSPCLPAARVVFPFARAGRTAASKPSQ
jgi:hypothetical protein